MEFYELKPKRQYNKEAAAIARKKHYGHPWYAIEQKIKGVPIEVPSHVRNTNKK